VTSTSGSIFAARRPGADDLAVDADGEAAGHVGEIAHARRHAERVLLGHVAGRLALRGRGDRLALRGDDREVPRAVHHQEGDQPAAAVDHREADLTAELVGLGYAGREHLAACLVDEPMGSNEVWPGMRVPIECVVPTEASAHTQVLGLKD
jgi:hypothetical protein